MNTAHPPSVMRLTAMATAVVLMALACASLVSATYEPAGSPILSIGDTFVIYSGYHQSFCHWQGPDPQMIYDWENLKCNVGADDLSQASRFLMTSPYPHQVCGRIPMSPYNISVSFATKSPICSIPDPLHRCYMLQVIGGLRLINCGDNGGNNPVQASFLLTNTAPPLYGVDGWLHGGETPIAITSVFTGATCGVDTAFGKILCPGPGSEASKVFYLIPVDPEPDHEC
ncbi:hypothetical protein pqer_cds_487 [Pandoravirus quercus]|uniref:Uncharacterized protein n=1 Tax=Pandoravirus quercus TaxID=2107709 RepID=A0A2U7U904_9VIRU|nr:hypothetical protein pqer_cds_487 [Pandoravirus quercus]AVK74909.1 hypothetical protein pqer_cds_487 [Pandoravirus quercus]